MISNIITALKILLNDLGIDLTVDFENIDHVDPNGSVVLYHDGLEQLNYPLPDYTISFTIQGQTFIENDLDKNKINQLYQKALKFITECNQSTLTLHSKENICAIKLQNSFISSDSEVHSFTINFDVIVTDFYF